MTATTIPFTGRITAARAAASAATTALTTALEHVHPLTAETHDLFLTRPAAYAQCLRQVAEILDTLPTLRQQAKIAAADLAALEALACWKCHGTGQYSAPTGATRRGIPYCFACDGSGQAKR